MRSASPAPAPPPLPHLTQELLEHPWLAKVGVLSADAPHQAPAALHGAAAKVAAVKLAPSGHRLQTSSVAAP